MKIGLGLISLGLLSFTLLSCTPHFRWRALHQELEGLRGARTTERPAAPYQDFPGAIHVHSLLSHDSRGTLAEIVQGAREAGDRFVILTDHHNPRIFTQGFEGWSNGVLVMRGSEIIKGCRGLTGAACNSLLAIGVESYFDPAPLTMPQVVEQVRHMGGLAFAAHLGGFVDWDAFLNGMEIYDILDDAVDRWWAYPKYFFDILYSFRQFPDEVFLSILDRPHRALEKWDALNAGRRIVAIAGNDAHQNTRVMGRQVDPYRLTLRFVRTHILAPALDREQVLAALAAGHVYIAFDSLVDATGFDFWAEDGDKRRRMMGDEMTRTPRLLLKVQVPIAGKVEMIRNGKVFRTGEGGEMTVPVEERGVYRVEVSLRIRGRWWPWIYSNPIYIRS